MINIFFINKAKANHWPHHISEINCYDLSELSGVLRVLFWYLTTSLISETLYSLQSFVNQIIIYIIAFIENCVDGSHKMFSEYSVFNLW